MNVHIFSFWTSWKIISSEWVAIMYISNCTLALDYRGGNTAQVNWSFLEISPAHLEASGSVSLKMWTIWIINCYLSYSKVTDSHAFWSGGNSEACSPIKPWGGSPAVTMWHVRLSLSAWCINSCLLYQPTHLSINGCLQDLGTSESPQAE